jgi:hypothetical protein
MLAADESRMISPPNRYREYSVREGGGDSITHRRQYADRLGSKTKKEENWRRKLYRIFLHLISLLLLGGLLRGLRD